MRIIKILTCAVWFSASAFAHSEEELVKKADIYLEKKIRNRYFKNLVYPGDFSPKEIVTASQYLETKRENFLKNYDNARYQAFKNGIMELGASFFSNGISLYYMTQDQKSASFISLLVGVGCLVSAMNHVVYYKSLPPCTGPEDALKILADRLDQKISRSQSQLDETLHLYANRVDYSMEVKK